MSHTSWDDAACVSDANFQFTKHGSSWLWMELMQQVERCVHHKNFRTELIEKLYHPDRYERMVNNYGEIWADIHLPYY